MGTSSEGSVTKPIQSVWDCPNLLVADGACWASSGCANPTLTMMAIAGPHALILYGVSRTITARV